MSEKWERNYTEITADAGVTPRPSSTWRELLPVMRSKWDLKNIATDKTAAFKVHEKSAGDTPGQVPYMLDHENCAFCQKASEGVIKPSYGLAGLSCKACVLECKCYDTAWVVPKIYFAMLAEDWKLFDILVAQGLNDIAKIVTEKEKEDDHDIIDPK